MAKDFLAGTNNRYLRRISKEKVDDIEKLMKTIQKIVDLRESEGITLLRQETDLMKKVPLNDLCNEFQRTNDELIKYAREKCTNFNREQAISLLLPLLELQKKNMQVTIFSTNYDTAIESVCQDRGIPYLDGFVLKAGDEYPRFHPSNFTDGMNKDNILFYKLHGSVNWWSDDSRQIIFKLSLELGGVPGVKNLMIYPAQKEDVLVFPYNVLESALIMRLHSITELIAIGHKFGDANIASAVKVALERPDFKLVLVNPEGAIIKKNIFHDHPQVIAIEKKFEDWVKEDLPLFINDSEKKIESEAPTTKNWIVEDYHRFMSFSPLKSVPEMIRDLTLRCPFCGHSQYHRTTSGTGDLMCKGCKKVTQYSLPG